MNDFGKDGSIFINGGDDAPARYGWMDRWILHAFSGADRTTRTDAVFFHDGTIVIDPAQRIVFRNNGAARMLRHACEAIYGLVMDGIHD